MLDNEITTFGNIIDEALGVKKEAETPKQEPEPSQDQWEENNARHDPPWRYCRLCAMMGEKTKMVNCDQCHYWFHLGYLENTLITPGQHS